MRAVKWLVGLAEDLKGIQVHLLNVQFPAMSGDISSYSREDMVETIRRDDVESALSGARALLESAAIAFTVHVDQGEIAETIARYASEHDCDSIVMGTRGMGAIRNLVLGFVATKVIHLIDQSITLVK